MGEKDEHGNDSNSSERHHQADSGRSHPNPSRRRILKGVSSSALALSLAGCSGGGDGGDGSGGSGGSGGNGDGSGGGGGTETTKQEPIKMGVLTAMDYALGKSLKRGAEIAIGELNSSGGINGRKIKPSYKNTKADPQTGQSVYQELTTGENVDVTVGTWSSEVLISVLPQIAQQETLHLSSGASTPKASQQVASNYDKYKYFFRTGPINSIHIGQLLIDVLNTFYKSNGLDKVAFLGENYAWADPTYKRVLDGIDAGEVDVDVVMKKRFAAGTKDFTPIYDEVEQSGANAVLALMAYTSTPATVQWNKQERPFQLGGVLNSLQPSNAYSNLNGNPQYAVAWVNALPGSKNTPKTQPFIEKYQQKFDSTPLYPAFVAYDSVHTYAAAAKATGSIAEADLIPKLEEIKFTGTQGQINYYGKDAKFPHDIVYDIEKLPQPFFQWQKENGEGVQETVWPDNLATAEYQQPDWL